MKNFAEAALAPSLAAELRRIAQNDYMVNTRFLPDGEMLNQAADLLERAVIVPTEHLQKVRDFARQLDGLGQLL